MEWFDGPTCECRARNSDQVLRIEVVQAELRGSSKGKCALRAMVTCYLHSTRRPASAPLAELLASYDIVWIDVLKGTDELAEVHAATGLAIPSLASLNEIEHSSGMRREGDAVVLSLPLPRAGGQSSTLLPTGFVLTKDLLLTVRFDAEVI